jgi:hypothetical protein
LEQQLERITAIMKAQSFCQDLAESLPLLVGDVHERSVRNIDVWLREVESRLGDKEQYLDVWAQGWFTSVFAYNGFTVTMNPLGEAGPDLLIQREGKDIYVEVRRFHTDYEERHRLQEESPEDILVPYGDFMKDTRKVIDGIVTKSRQGRSIPNGACYLVAVRSDKESIEDLEFGHAVEELQQEAAQGGGKYSAISGVLFYHGYLILSTGKRWYLWQNPNAEQQRRLTQELATILGNLQLPPTHPRLKNLSQERCHG